MAPTGAALAAGAVVLDSAPPEARETSAWLRTART